MRAIDASKKAPVTIEVTGTIAEAAAIMDREVVGAVVVLEGQRPVGIVTDRDLVVRALAHHLPLSTRVDTVMSGDLVSLEASADIREAVKVFEQRPLRRLPLVDEGRVVGMLTVDDLLIEIEADLARLVRPVTGQVMHGRPEPFVPLWKRAVQRGTVSVHPSVHPSASTPAARSGPGS